MRPAHGRPARPDGLLLTRGLTRAALPTMRGSTGDASVAGHQPQRLLLNAGGRLVPARRDALAANAGRPRGAGRDVDGDGLLDLVLRGADGRCASCATRPRRATSCASASSAATARASRPGRDRHRRAPVLRHLAPSATSARGPRRAPRPGRVERLDGLRIRWPDGSVQQVLDLPAGASSPSARAATRSRSARSPLDARGRAGVARPPVEAPAPRPLRRPPSPRRRRRARPAVPAIVRTAPARPRPARPRRRAAGGAAVPGHHRLLRDVRSCAKTSSASASSTGASAERHPRRRRLERRGARCPAARRSARGPAARWAPLLPAWCLYGPDRRGAWGSSAWWTSPRSSARPRGCCGQVTPELRRQTAKLLPRRSASSYSDRSG